jgi:hypothetical protein
MGAWRPLIGRLLFLLAAFVACYLGATLGWLSTREVRASHNFGDVPDSGHTQHPRAFIQDRSIARPHGGRTMPCGA